MNTRVSDMSTSQKGSASIEACPNCGKDEVGTYTADDSFLYGVENPVRLVAKDVLFFRCMACDLVFTGEDGEIKRANAVVHHLGAQAKKLRTALLKAVESVQTWHNMGVPPKEASTLWDIYWRNAPEMKLIREALQQ